MTGWCGSFLVNAQIKPLSLSLFFFFNCIRWYIACFWISNLWLVFREFSGLCRHCAFQGGDLGLFIRLGICTLIIGLAFLGGTLALLSVWLACDSCLSRGLSVPQVPAVNFAVGAFLEAWLCMFVFGGLCHGMRLVLCGMLPQSVNGTYGDERVHILSITYRILAFLSSPYLICVYEKDYKANNGKGFIIQWVSWKIWHRRNIN